MHCSFNFVCDLVSFFFFFFLFFFFFFNAPATTAIYTLSLHDALPICADAGAEAQDDNVVDADFEEVDPDQDKK